MIPDLSLGRRLAELFPVERQSQAADVERTIEDRINYPTQRFTIACTSATRPSNPRTGDRIYETDTNLEYTWNGTAWVRDGVGAVGTWTPVVTQSFAIGSTPSPAGCRYIQIGKLVIGWFYLTIPSPHLGAAGNHVTVTVPVTIATPGFIIGVGGIYDASAGLGYSGSTFSATSSTLDFRAHGAATAPDNRLGAYAFTAGLTTNDVVLGNFMYEAA